MRDTNLFPVVYIASQIHSPRCHNILCYAEGGLIAGFIHYNQIPITVVRVECPPPHGLGTRLSSWSAAPQPSHRPSVSTSAQGSHCHLDHVGLLRRFNPYVYKVLSTVPGMKEALKKCVSILLLSLSSLLSFSISAVFAQFKKPFRNLMLTVVSSRSFQVWLFTVQPLKHFWVVFSWDWVLFLSVFLRAYAAGPPTSGSPIIAPVWQGRPAPSASSPLDCGSAGLWTRTWAHQEPGITLTLCTAAPTATLLQVCLGWAGLFIIRWTLESTVSVIKHHLGFW